MINVIKPASVDNNLLVKFPDDLTVSASAKNARDTVLIAVANIKDWPNENRMIVNISKTWEKVSSKGVSKLFGVSFQDGPYCWDLHVY